MVSDHLNAVQCRLFKRFHYSYVRYSNPHCTPLNNSLQFLDPLLRLCKHHWSAFRERWLVEVSLSGRTLPGGGSLKPLCVAQLWRNSRHCLDKVAGVCLPIAGAAQIAVWNILWHRTRKVLHSTMKIGFVCNRIRFDRPETRQNYNQSSMYSGDLKAGRVCYSNRQKLSDLWMV